MSLGHVVKTWSYQPQTKAKARLSPTGRAKAAPARAEPAHDQAPQPRLPVLSDPAFTTFAGAGGSTDEDAAAAGQPGTVPIGGTKSGSGGAKPTGGAAPTGGTKATGGTTANGGTKATGGTGSTGGAKATGGVGGTAAGGFGAGR